MSDTPQFRTVLRGADPEQVAEAMKELQTSLVVSRRAAADRTIELSRLQEEHETLQAGYAAAQHRLQVLEQSGGSAHPESAAAAPAPSYGDLGARIGSMLSLAEEEATQIRAAAEKDSAEQRDRAVQALAAELVAEQTRLEETKARAAALDGELAQQREQADVEHGRQREHAMQEAEQIRQQARSDAESLHRQAEEQRAAAVGHREQVHEHLGQIVAMIEGVLDGRGGTTTSAGGLDGHAPDGRATQQAELAPTVDDIGHQSQPDPQSEPQPQSQPEPQGQPEPQRQPEPQSHTDPDATVPDAVDPGPGAQDGRPDHPAADATQVFEPVTSPPPAPRRSAARESRRQFADAGDSFVGEPWQQEDGATTR